MNNRTDAASCWVAQVKKFKEKATIAERAVVAQQTQILKLEDKCAQITDALASTGKSMKQLLDEAALREALEEKDKVVADLENRVRVRASPFNGCGLAPDWGAGQLGAAASGEEGSAGRVT